jgi:hypothetical protein
MPLPIIDIKVIPQTVGPCTIQGNTAELHFPSVPKGNTPDSIPENISISVRLGTGLGKPRMWVEKWEENFDPLAIMLAVSPDIDFKYSPLPFPSPPPLTLKIRPEEREIIFLLDRSGSMDGEPTRQLMYTMFHALKFIPSHSTFNIVCFGSSHQFLFPSAVLPTFDNLYAARHCIYSSPYLFFFITFF